MSNLKQQRAIIDENRIREFATSILTEFQMERGKPIQEARKLAAAQVAISPLNLLKKIMAGGVTPDIETALWNIAVAAWNAAVDALDAETAQDEADDTSVLRPGNPSASTIERMFRGGR